MNRLSTVAGFAENEKSNPVHLSVGNSGGTGESAPCGLWIVSVSSGWIPVPFVCVELSCVCLGCRGCRGWGWLIRECEWELS